MRDGWRCVALVRPEVIFCLSADHPQPCCGHTLSECDWHTDRPGSCPENMGQDASADVWWLPPFLLARSLVLDRVFESLNAGCPIVIFLLIVVEVALEVMSGSKKPLVDPRPYVGKRRNKEHERKECFCLDCLRYLRKDSPAETKQEEVERYDFFGACREEGKTRSQQSCQEKAAGNYHRVPEKGNCVKEVGKDRIKRNDAKSVIAVGQTRPIDRSLYFVCVPIMIR